MRIELGRLIAAAGLALSTLAGCAGPSATAEPNLVANGIDVIWDDTTRAVTGYISNRGQTAAGPFLVYFNATESPESQRDRPQVRKEVAGLAPGERIRFAADFAPLATTRNFHLDHVTAIELLVNPKAQIAEENTADNALLTALPPAVAGAVEIQGRPLRPTGDVAATTEIPGQTLIPPELMLLVAVEITAVRPFFMETGKLTLTVRRGQELLATATLPESAFPTGNSPGPITGAAPSQQLFIFDAPIPLTQGDEHRFQFTTSGVRFMIGTGEDFGLSGNMIVDDHDFIGRDLVLKLYLLP